MRGTLARPLPLYLSINAYVVSANLHDPRDGVAGCPYHCYKE